MYSTVDYDVSLGTLAHNEKPACASRLSLPFLLRRNLLRLLLSHLRAPHCAGMSHTALHNTIRP